jgi:Zn-dependent protease with chaperone function
MGGRWVLLWLLGAAPLWAGSKTGPETVDGYAEWRKDKVLIVDGQAVRTSSSTHLKLPKGMVSADAIPLGYEVAAKGLRGADGVIVAKELEAKPNGISMFENEARTATNELEQKWLSHGRIYDDGGIPVAGELFTEGRDVERVRRVVARLIPPYLTPDVFRIYVVESDDWNAFACANGMVVVYTQLLADMDDDELAIILGHELVHATHEHTRRECKKGFWTHLGLATLVAATSDMKDKTARDALRAVGVLATVALRNGYSREHEDQADRVGLRYAYEGGYDVTKAPAMWRRFARKYEEQGKVANFFFSDHSLSTARANNLEREIALNYPDAQSRHDAIANGEVRYREDRRPDDEDRDARDGGPREEGERR